MGIIIRQSLKSTSVTISSALIGALNTILLMMMLDKSTFGLYNLGISYMLFGSELILALTQILYFIFVKKYESKSEREREAGFNRYITKPSIYIAGIILLLLLIYAFFLREYFDFAPGSILHYIDRYWYLFYLLMLVYGFYNLMTSILAAKHKNTISAIAKDLVPRLLNITAILLFATQILSISGLIIMLYSQYLLGGLVAFYFVYKFDLFPWKNPIDITSTEKREISLYRITHIPFSLIWAFSLLSVSLIYSFVFPEGQARFAVFSISIFLANFMNIPYDQLSRSAISTISQRMREKDWTELQDIYQRANLSLMHLSSFVAIVLLAGIPLMITMTGEGKYAYLVTIAPFFIIGKWIDMSTGFSTELIMSSDKYSRIIYLSLIALLFMIVCYALLIPKYGDIGVAATMALWYLFFNILKIVFVYRNFGLIPFMKGKYWPSLIICLALVLLQTWALQQISNQWWNIAIGAANGILLIIALYALRLNQDALDIIRKILGKARD